MRQFSRSLCWDATGSIQHIELLAPSEGPEEAFRRDSGRRGSCFRIEGLFGSRHGGVAVVLGRETTMSNRVRPFGENGTIRRVQNESTRGGQADGQKTGMCFAWAREVGFCRLLLHIILGTLRALRCVLAMTSRRMRRRNTQIRDTMAGSRTKIHRKGSTKSRKRHHMAWTESKVALLSSYRLRIAREQNEQTQTLCKMFAQKKVQFSNKRPRPSPV